MLISSHPRHKENMLEFSSIKTRKMEEIAPPKMGQLFDWRRKIILTKKIRSCRPPLMSCLTMLKIVDNCVFILKLLLFLLSVHSAWKEIPVAKSLLWEPGSKLSFILSCFPRGRHRVSRSLNFPRLENWVSGRWSLDGLSGIICAKTNEGWRGTRNLSASRRRRTYVVFTYHFAKCSRQKAACHGRKETRFCRDAQSYEPTCSEKASSRLIDKKGNVTKQGGTVLNFKHRIFGCTGFCSQTCIAR